MDHQSKERIWVVATQEASHHTCQACRQPIQPGEQAIACPRCKQTHHLSCWTDKGGCSSIGCFQLADPSIMGNKKRTYDPPTKDTLSWLPAVLTVMIIALVIVGATWAWFRGNNAADVLTVMIPSGPDVQTIQRVADSFDTNHDDLTVSVLTIPVDPEGMYYEQKLVIMLAAREAPDIIILPYDRFVVYATQGALTPLNDLKQKASEAVPYGKRLANGVIAQNLYGLPHPSRAGLYAIPSLSKKAEPARELLLALIKELPYTANVDDRKASVGFDQSVPTGK